jgi:uncharacterized protein YjhX (UPF0386 family)
MQRATGRQAGMMKTIHTLDRVLALRCELARIDGKKITVNYETRGGWNRASGTVQSVRKLKTNRPLKPYWEIIIGEPTITGASSLQENEPTSKPDTKAFD